MCSWAEDQLANLLCSMNCAQPTAQSEDKLEQLFTRLESWPYYQRTLLVIKDECLCPSP